MPDRIPVVKVWLNRAEGPTREIGQRTVSSFAEADQVIRKWAVSAPPAGNGYDKVDFKVEWSDGESYEGRFDMDKSHLRGSNLLGSQMQDHLLFLSGLHKPSHIDREAYNRYLDEIGFGEGSESRASAFRMLQTHEL